MNIKAFIVICNRSAIIKVSNNEEETIGKVFHMDSLIDVIDKSNKNKAEILSKRKLLNLRDLFLESDNPLIVSASDYFDINPKDIMTGVQCPRCMLITMIRKNRTWKCPNCRYNNRKSHEQALQDFLLLIKPTINNSQCRDFLHLDSPDVCKRILNSSRLNRIGNTKGKQYFMS